jgi:hypothetical protein
MIDTLRHLLELHHLVLATLSVWPVLNEVTNRLTSIRRGRIIENPPGLRLLLDIHIILNCVQLVSHFDFGSLATVLLSTEVSGWRLR